MWSWIYDARQYELADALEQKDSQRLAVLLRAMFRRDFVLGMASGPLLSQTDQFFGAWAWGVKCLDGLASLAEVAGVVAVENPEQGGTGLAFGAGIEGAIAAVEERLGFRVDFPSVGAPSGLAVDGRLITPDTPDQIYAALRLRDAFVLHVDDNSGGAGLAPSVVEIGGGYGAMAYWFTKCCPDFASYTIVDLPIVNVLQGYFLGSVLGPEEIALFGEPNRGRIQLIPNVALDRVETPFDILANKDSMPEMPSDAMCDYLAWGAANCRGLFYSYNQETAADFLGEQQGIVHRAVASLGGFKRIRRDRAWVRDGYVEEVYLPSEVA